MKILVTGAAGFIGMHTSIKLLNRGDQVIGVDNLNDYYDVNLKNSRLSKLLKFTNFKFLKGDIEDDIFMKGIFEESDIEYVIHLAAQAGVRYSLINPNAYIESNIKGFMNILELCRHNSVKHLTYASSSSVYGGNENLPFSEHHSVDHPVSLYAATKKSNELMAHTYSHLFKLPTTGLRFFTVYGPWGRPDMALFLFTKAILNSDSIDVYNNGNMMRDFTYIDDIVEGVVRVSDKIATSSNQFSSIDPDPATSKAPFRIFNIGNSQPTPLNEYIEAIENALEIKAKKNFLPMQLGDVQSTSADTSELKKWVDFSPNTPVSLGVQNFVDWYKKHYNYK
jgi:UDP-glucuronate 4-epimerase